MTGAGGAWRHVGTPIVERRDTNLRSPDGNDECAGKGRQPNQAPHAWLWVDLRSMRGAVQTHRQRARPRKRRMLERTKRFATRRVPVREIEFAMRVCRTDSDTRGSRANRCTPPGAPIADACADR